jgi:hypothetical protein
MSAPALAGVGRPTLQIRGTRYPVLLPTWRDPRLHLAAVIVSLQILGQVAFHFRLSIAQILISLGTCALLEFGIAFFRQGVIMWPASALLTGNGVAFILRVPGTQHGDWWSMNGWWIFAATAAVSLLSKYLIRYRGRHIFNPSNFGLVLCFLLLGPELADPLEFWWAPFSPWLVLALVIILTGGFAILIRLRLIWIAVGFWLAFAAGIAVLAASGHEMTARWHLGPISGWSFWWVLVTSPEILVFLFFMITDPKTVPDGRVARVVYAVGVALIAVLLIAPQRTEFASKVAVLGALAIVCGARPLLERFVLPRARQVGWWPRRGTMRRVATGGAALAGAVVFVGALVLAGIPARSSAEAASSEEAPSTTRLPVVTVAPSSVVASRIGRPMSLRIARDLVADLNASTEALRLRSTTRAGVGANGDWLVDLLRRIRESKGAPIAVPSYDVRRVRLSLEPGDGQGPPLVVATLAGTVSVATYDGSPPQIVQRSEAAPLAQTLELTLQGNRYAIVRARGASAASSGAGSGASGAAVAGSLRLTDVAGKVGLRFRHGAYRFGSRPDTTSMMGGGLCWLDYDGDGWLDLFVVNSYSDPEYADWQQRGGLPRTALFHNVKGRFVDVSAASKANLPVRGDGCVVADFDLDGDPDVFVTTAGYNVETEGYDALLWNDGDGTFTEGAKAAGITAPGWHTGAAVADVNGDGRPDLYVAGYTEPDRLTPGSTQGFPANHIGVRDLLYLNVGGGKGKARFREVGRAAGLDRPPFDHSLGAEFADLDGDGRVDLYVANDLDPNRLYAIVPRPGGAASDPSGLGFRLVDRARRAGVDDPNAGMGIAVGDYSDDGLPDLLVTNSRRQLHAAFRGRGKTFADARAELVAALGSSLTGWGASFSDLDLDGRLDLVIANGAIPVLRPKQDARPIQVAVQDETGELVDVSRAVGLRPSPRLNGRGVAVADYDNDGDLDVAVNSIGGPLVLLQTTGTTGHWLEVRLKRLAPGARVTVVLDGDRRLEREVHAGSSYLSSEDPRVHFGLGEATTVQELVVRYPDGRVTRLEDVRADRVVDVG